MVLWLRSFEVKLDGEGVVCTSIFGSKSLRWEEIDRAELRLKYRLKYEQDEPGQAFRAPFRLVIFFKAYLGETAGENQYQAAKSYRYSEIGGKAEASVAGCKVNVPPWMAPLARD